MNTFNDDNELAFFEEPRRRPPRDRGSRSQRSGPRGPRRPASANSVLRLAGLVALAIAIVFGFVFWVGSCGGKSTSDYYSYLAAMQPLAQDSAKVGDEFAQALGTPGLTLESLSSDLADWSRREQADYLAAVQLRPPGPLQGAHAQALATFDLRYRSLARLADTLTFAKSERVSASVAGAALAKDAELLSASDIVWEQLYKLPVIQALKDQAVKAVIVPSSRIVTSADIVRAHSLATVFARVSASAGDGKVTGIHGSNLISTSAVENGITTALSTSTSTTVSAGAGSNLVIDVVFADSGRYPEVRIPVTLTVSAGGTTVYTKTTIVSQIAAGEQATVSFANVPLPPSAFGPSAAIAVSIGRVRGEKVLDNNKATYPVFFQLAPG